MEANKTTVSRGEALIALLPARSKVFVPALILLVFAATGLCVLVAVKMFVLSPALFLLWYSILAGPFSALWILPLQPGWATIGAVNLTLLFAHPIWPSRATAILTIVAFASWLFWGMAVSFSSV
jgi:hypothetical protein